MKTYELHNVTMIVDQTSGLQIEVTGALALAVGAVVQFGNPNRDAKVVRTRLQLLDHGLRAQIVLDVELPAGALVNEDER